MSQAMISVIETDVLRIFNAIKKSENLEIRVPYVQWEDLSLNSDGLITKKMFSKKLISFANNPKKFVIFVKLMERSHNLLQSNSCSTKRDVYYEDTKLYGNQKYMDTILSEMCSFYMTPHWNFGIITTSKTLIFGDLICFNEVAKRLQRFDSHTEGSLLPSAACRLRDFRSSARFLLVVEKDATFQKLLDCGFYELFKPCIFLTSKGYPDLNTRMFLKQISTELPKLPIYALVDADPYGLDIYASYKYGTKSSVVITLSTGPLCAPNMELIGVLPVDLEELRLPSTELLPMNKWDLCLLESFHKRPYYAVDHILREQIQCLESTQIKAEIQSLSAISDNYLCDFYLKEKLISRINGANSQLIQIQEL